MGRDWQDGAGNFMGSTVVRADAPGQDAALLSLVCGTAAYDAVLSFLPDPVPLRLKWPNDLLFGDAKLAGILLERTGDWIVCGFGVNLALAPAIPSRRTVALAELTVAPPRDLFAQRLAETLLAQVAQWRRSGGQAVINRWLSAAHPVGTPLSQKVAGGEQVTGRFAGLTEAGGLRLRLPDGALHVIQAGEVTMVGGT
jgi:BirA family biotin operon repressor/biotin-[acetyl-CoA-carboxylase] ligase